MELDQLNVKLHNKKRQNIGSCAVLVWGPPGCGKSHLVRQYVWQHRQDYDAGIFWVDCKTKESIFKSFWDISQALQSVATDSPEERISSTSFVDTVRNTLRSLKSWLLVLDGLSFDNDSEMSHFAQFLPDRQGNNIIYTSVDRTLAKRDLLLNPTALKVRPLSEQDACQLLYKALSIQEPCSRQKEKALQLVKHHECLPLGIHAAAHVLIARGRALEKYKPGSSNARLAEPFIEIISVMRDNGHQEAFALLSLLSFFNHTIPVDLLRFGQRGVSDLGFDIRSGDRADGTGKRELDNTIATRIRYGLVERSLQTYTTSSEASSSPESERHRQAQASPRIPQLREESSGLDLVLSRAYASSKKSFRTIDTLRIHSVAQSVLRDQIKYQDADSATFFWWLYAAVRLLTRSYDVATQKMRIGKCSSQNTLVPLYALRAWTSTDRACNSGRGLVRDYREYETQVARLMEFLPRTDGSAKKEIREARHDLHEIKRLISREIQNRFPSQSSSESFGAPQIHESVFDRGTDSSDDAEPYTPTSGLTRTSTWSVESSDPPEALQDEDGHRVLEEYVQARMSARRREALLQPPIRPSSGLEYLSDVAYDTDDESAVRNRALRRWGRSDSTEIPDSRSSALSAIFKGRPSHSHKDLGEWKPLAASPSISRSYASVVAARRPSNQNELPRLVSTHSEAEAALASVHTLSRPPSRGGSLRSLSRTAERVPLMERPSNTQRLRSEENVDNLVHHSQRLSLSPRLGTALLANQAARKLPHPDLPSGYTSVPMSRNISAESHNSLHTAPAASAPLSTPPLPVVRPSPINVNAIEFGKVGQWTTSPIHASEQRLSTSVGGRSVQFGQMMPISIVEARSRARSREKRKGRERTKEDEKEKEN